MEEEQTLPDVPFNDPTRFCRLCFAERDIHWVIRTCGTEVDLPFVNTIGECVGIWLSLEEDFPCAVCRTCFKRLEEILDFRETSRRCDEALKAKRQQDPEAMVLFYDYPEDKVFINGSAKPGFFRDDPDFESETIVPEVVLQEEKSKEEPTGPERRLIQMTQEEKQQALRSYMDSYFTWSTDINRKKDDDEVTLLAPESLDCDNQPELDVLFEKYVNPGRRTPPPIKKLVPLSRYTCCFCQQSFRTKAILQGHKTAVHNKGPKSDLVCFDCGQTFPSIAAMKLHSIRHRRELLISCKTCGIQFTGENDLEAHKKNNGCRMMAFGKCQYCDRVFSRRGRYIFHLKKLHPDKPLPPKSDERKSYRRPPKPAKPISPSEIQRIRNAVEQRGRFVVLLDPLPDEIREACLKTLPKEKLVCTLCYEQFPDRPSYDGHLPACFPDVEGYGDPNSQSQPPPPYKLCDCDACTAIFEAIDPFVEHLREHEQPLLIKPHDCIQCSTGHMPKFLLHPHSPTQEIFGD